MGVMKTARTAMTLKMFPASKEEQRTLMSLIAREEQHRQYQYESGRDQKERESDSDLIEPVYMRTSYVGNKPLLEGQYIVLDLATQARSLVVLTKYLGALWAYPAYQSPVNLISYNMRSYRWFRLSLPIPADLVALRELPATRTEPEPCKIL